MATAPSATKDRPQGAVAAAEQRLAPASGDSSGSFAFLVAISLALVGVGCLALPALGVADLRFAGAAHLTFIMAAVAVLALSSLLEVLATPAKADGDTAGGAAAAPASKRGAPSVPLLRGMRPGVPETDLTLADGALPTARPHADNQDSGVRSRTIQEGGEHAEDSVWEADWANLDRSAKSGGDGDMMMRNTSSVEVFELNGTPTWLARMQQRRDQARRSGKEKLAQRLEKQIADARRTQERERGQDEAPNVDDAVDASPAEGPKGDDVYGFDWAAMTAEQAAVAVPT